MKISTITCHDVYNYGASLQAYALQHYLESQGHQYSIINYKPPYLSNHYRLDLVANSKFDRPFVKQIYLLAKLPGRIRGLRRKRRFDRFTQKFLHLTEKRYTSSEEIESDLPASDLYIAGSDQIWNTFFKNGRDRAFYLDFAKNNGSRRISYAASFATDKIHNGAEEKVKSWLANFDSISVRESSALDLLAQLGFNDAELVCDPVFLLSKEQWLKLAEESEYNAGWKDYIFLYDCEQSDKLRSVAERLREISDRKIVAVSETSGKYANKNLDLGGPLEFLSLIVNAGYVVANSFHALAFAIIFQKPFFIVNRKEGINTRMRDFLTYLSLNRRLIDSPEQVTLAPIEFGYVNAKVESMIEKSKNFLSKQIEL